MTDLSELLSRVCAATGPDRELDALIYAALGFVARQATPEEDPARNTYWFAPTSERLWHYGDTPKLTASVDAALALVERVLPGWSWTGGHINRDDGHGGHWAVLYSVSERDRSSGDGMFKSVPLAILAALLKALEAGATK